MNTVISAADTGLFSSLSYIYNKCADAPDVLYRPLGDTEFSRIFGSGNRYTFAAFSGGVPVGFASGSLGAKNVSYLSYVGVLPEYRRQGIATKLLDTLEAALRDAGAERTDTVFYDTASLPWIIPGTDNGHPCAPGVLTGSDSEGLLRARGYSEWCAQISYYLDLYDYEIPEKTAEKKKLLTEEGLSFGLYSPDKHKGLYEIFDKIGNPGWKNGVLSHPERPTVVCSDNNKDGLIVAFIGALCPQKEGGGIRGNFCGVGTDPLYRGRGIATVLFAEMCGYQKECGAEFMSLYTGETMSARHVYEAAGCVPAARWSNLRKIYN